jgi:hypothetical protein
MAKPEMIDLGLFNPEEFAKAIYESFAEMGAMFLHVTGVTLKG